MPFGGPAGCHLATRRADRLRRTLPTGEPTNAFTTRRRPCMEVRMTLLERSTASSLLSDFDLHLFNQGTHTRIYRKLGAHPRLVDGTPGTFFATWAPDADAVSVRGDFNAWDPEATPLRPHAS